METTPHIDHFVTFIKQKNGNYKVSRTVTQEANIYRWLAKQGYGRCTVEGKMITFRKTGEDIISSSLHDMRDVFHDYLSNVPSGELPDGYGINDLRDWDYRRSAIKQNGLFRHYLEATLTESEIHQLRLKTDAEYAKRDRIKRTVEMLDQQKFKQAVDVLPTFMKGSLIYYKPIQPQQYLLIIHHRPDPKADGCFEYCIATYHSEKQIGRSPNMNAVNTTESFYLDRDFPLIEKYLAS